MAEKIYHEDNEQAVVFEWAAYIPVLKWLHAIPNGGNRNAQEAARMKGQGVTPGIHDIFLPLSRRGYHGLYIEMKRNPKQGRAVPTKEQIEFRDYVLKEGYDCKICYGAGEAIDKIKEYCSL